MVRVEKVWIISLIYNNMKYLKSFESETKRDIELALSGLLVDLYDIGIDI